jgi:hypothetical protein
MSTVRGGTDGCSALGRNNQRLGFQVTNVIPRLRSRRWQPPGMSAAAANDRFLRRRVGKRHRNHRSEPAGKTTIRISDPTGSSDSGGFIRVCVRSARRVENHLSSLVRRVHWDEPNPDPGDLRVRCNPSTVILRVTADVWHRVHRTQRYQPSAILGSLLIRRPLGCNGAAAERSLAATPIHPP